MTTIKEASTAFWYPNEVRHQPKYPIERAEPQDILGSSQGSPTIINWHGRLFHFRKTC